VSVRESGSAPTDLVIPQAALAGVMETQSAAVVYPEAAAHALAWAQIEGWVQRTAQGLASDGSTTAGELVSEARHELWELDPSRFDASDEIWLKGALRRAMRRERDDEVRRRGMRSAVPFRVRLLNTGAIAL